MPHWLNGQMSCDLKRYIVSSDIHRTLLHLKGHLTDNRRGEILRNGIHVTLLGSPNVGKSSIMNVLGMRLVVRSVGGLFIFVTACQ